MNWHLDRMACFDLESTGVDPHRDRIVTGAVILVGGGQERVTDGWLIDPIIDIPEGATAIHGVTTEHARTGQHPSAAIPEIAEDLIAAVDAGIPIVGHNVVYDITMLWAELVRHDREDLATRIATLEPVVDTKIIEHHLDPFRPKKEKAWSSPHRPQSDCGSHQLVEACRLWNIDLTAEHAHGAEADALASGRLAWRLATSPLAFAQYDNPKRPLQRIDPAAMTLEQLHAWQMVEYIERAESYQAYRRGVQRTKPPEGADPDFVASKDWPFQPPPSTWSPQDLPTMAEAVHA